MTSRRVTRNPSMYLVHQWEWTKVATRRKLVFTECAPVSFCDRTMTCHMKCPDIAILDHPGTPSLYADHNREIGCTFDTIIPFITNTWLRSCIFMYYAKYVQEYFCCICPLSMAKYVHILYFSSTLSLSSFFLQADTWMNSSFLCIDEKIFLWISFEAESKYIMTVISISDAICNYGYKATYFKS